nr:NADH dehydrogenase ubiquinone Fe-S protein 4 [Hyphomicrobium denitrificans]
MGSSLFPGGALARINKVSKSVLTCGKPRAEKWRLRFERRMPPFVEPLMGWIGGDDTLTQVELDFPTMESAVRSAERQGLPYAIFALSSGAHVARASQRRRFGQGALGGATPVLPALPQIENAASRSQAFNPRPRRLKRASNGRRRVALKRINSLTFTHSVSGEEFRNGTSERQCGPASPREDVTANQP